jgi:hypothetical protein
MSGLAVHSGLNDSTAQYKVVNFNHGWGHRAEQSGIRARTTISGVTRAFGAPALPKGVSDLAVSGLTDITDLTFQPDTRGIVRELFKCCNVWPHGEVDMGWQTWFVVRSADGQKSISIADISGGMIVGKLGTVRLFREANPNAQIEPPFEQARVFAASPGGRQSGDEDCIMREDLPTVYAKAPNEFYWTDFDEPQGWGLCTKREGHSFNKLDRTTPRPRYFSASLGGNRGNCSAQICVNDSAAAVSRQIAP